VRSFGCARVSRSHRSKCSQTSTSWHLQWHHLGETTTCSALVSEISCIHCPYLPPPPSSQPTYLSSFISSYLPTYPPTYLPLFPYPPPQPTCQPTYLSSFISSYIHSNPLTYLSTSPTYIPTNLSFFFFFFSILFHSLFLPSYLRTYTATRLPTYLPTHPPSYLFANQATSYQYNLCPPSPYFPPTYQPACLTCSSNLQTYNLHLTHHSGLRLDRELFVSPSSSTPRLSMPPMSGTVKTKDEKTGAGVVQSCDAPLSFALLHCVANDLRECCDDTAPHGTLSFFLSSCRIFFFLFFLSCCLDHVVVQLYLHLSFSSSFPCYHRCLLQVITIIPIILDFILGFIFCTFLAFIFAHFGFHFFLIFASFLVFISPPILARPACRNVNASFDGVGESRSTSVSEGHAGPRDRQVECRNTQHRPTCDGLRASVYRSEYFDASNACLPSCDWVWL
jgi:hypothetical protein